MKNKKEKKNLLRLYNGAFECRIYQLKFSFVFKLKNSLKIPTGKATAIRTCCKRIMHSCTDAKATG